MKAQARKRRTEQFNLNRATALTMLAAGVLLLVTSAVYNSVTWAIIGLGLTFWGATLLYITPTRHVPIELLNASTTSALINIEKLLRATNAQGKGVYIPTKYLKETKSTVAFVSSKPGQRFALSEGIDARRLRSKNPEGLFLTPPGLALSKLIEKQLGTPYTRTDLRTLQQKLPRILIETLRIADNARTKAEHNTVTIEIANHVFSQNCEQTRRLERTHEAVGCVLCSALACALAETTGRPVTIEKEELDTEARTTRIQLRTLGE